MDEVIISRFCLLDDLVLAIRHYAWLEVIDVPHATGLRRAFSGTDDLVLDKIGPA
jgi:hypothetical protein